MVVNGDGRIWRGREGGRELLALGGDVGREGKGERGVMSGRGDRESSGPVRRVLQPCIE